MCSQCLTQCRIIYMWFHKYYRTVARPPSPNVPGDLVCHPGSGGLLTVQSHHFYSSNFPLHKSEEEGRIYLPTQEDSPKRWGRERGNTLKTREAGVPSPCKRGLSSWVYAHRILDPAGPTVTTWIKMIKPNQRSNTERHAHPHLQPGLRTIAIKSQ